MISGIASQAADYEYRETTFLNLASEIVVAKGDPSRYSIGFWVPTLEFIIGLELVTAECRISTKSPVTSTKGYPCRSNFPLQFIYPVHGSYVGAEFRSIAIVPGTTLTVLEILWKPRSTRVSMEDHDEVANKPD